MTTKHSILKKIVTKLFFLVNMLLILQGQKHSVEEDAPIKAI